MRLTKKLLSAFLALVMVFTMLPVQAFASETVSDGTRFQGVVGESRPQKAPAVENSVGSITIKVGETSRSFSSQDTSWYPKRWITTNATVATVEGSSDGSATITGVTPGIGTIKEERNEKMPWEEKDKWVAVQTIKVEVVTNVAGISLPDELRFNNKNPQKLTPTLHPEDSRGYTIIWTVDNDAIAKVDAHGNVTPVAPGETFVTAAVNDTDYSATCKIVVTEVGIEGIELQDWGLVVDSTGKMPITYTPAEPFNPQLTWQIDNPDIATIYPNGTIVAKSAGTTTVTATSGNISDTATLTVTTDGPRGISLDRDSCELNGLESVQLSATVYPSGLSDALRVITWESTNPSVATVDKTGMVHAVAPGNTTITATTVNGHQKTCSITVKQCPDNDSTAVYVYLNIVVRDGVSMDDWQINETGEWYTIGKINVPTSVLGPASKETVGEGVARDASKLMPYLPYIDLHTVNQNVASGVTLQDCRWELRWTGNGANGYPTASKKTWHLDGFLVLRNTQHTLTVKYQDTFGNTLKNDLVIPNIKVGSVQPVDIPKIDGYKPIKFGGYSIPESQTLWNVNISGDKEIIIQYQGEKTNYTRRYIEMATKEAIAKDEIFDATLGETVSASEDWAKTITNFEFADIINPKDMTIGPNPSANVFTLYYTRNQHTVTYKYTHPITGEEVTDGPETQGAGLEVAAKADPNITGYTFNGWEDTAETGEVKIKNGKFTMPDRDVTFTGSFSVPDDQMYAVRANIYLGNNGNGTPLATKDKVELTWEQLQAYYDMQHYQLANEFWNLTLNGNDDLNHSHWETNRKDANRVYNGGETDEEFHIVNIYLNADSTALVTLTYDANAENDSSVAGIPIPKKYLKGTVVDVAPAPTRDNYRFTEWNTDADGNGTGYPVGSTIKLTDATTLYAQWTPMTAEYKVQYLFQKADGSGYEQHDEVKDRTFNGNIGDEIDPLSHKLEPNPEGYTLNEQKIAEQGEITVEQTNTVVCVYYDRKTYEITYALEGENQPSVTLPQKGTGRYGATINIAGDLSADGYNFTGWYTKEGAKVTVGENDATFDMPAGNVTLYGTFSKRTDLAYTVNYIWNGTVLDTVSGTGTLDQEIVPAQKSFDGYSYKGQDANGTITANESSNVVNVYYYKNVKLTANDHNTLTYNGTTQTVTPGYVSSEVNAVFEGIDPTGSGRDANDKDAEKYPITFPDDTIDKVDKTKWYIVKEVEDGKLTINPKPVTLSTGDASRDYNGNPLTKDGVAGKEDFIAADVTEVKATGEQILVGESKNTIKITWAKGALATNYTITEELGTLTVTAPKDFDYVQKTNREGNYTVGQTVEFTITVKNIYDVDATVQLNEQKDMTITGVDDKGQDTLPAGETKTYSVSHEVTEADVEAGQIANNVTWTLTPHDEDIPPVKGDDESIIKNESYLVWYVLEGDTEGCINLDTMPKQANHKYGKTVTVWMPELAEGYKFSGWTVEGAEIVDGEVADEAGFKMPENAVILTGTISKEQVKVTYAAEAGGLVTDPKSGLTSKSFVETLSYGANAQGAVAVANEGYTFLGWKQDNAFVEQDEVIAPKEVKETVTYTAVFAKNYTVTYQIEGEKGAYETQTHYAGEADVEVLGNAPAKTGYDFSGWKTEDTAVLNGKFTMPEQDVLFTGSYTAHTNLVWYVLEGDTKGCTNILEMPKQANYAYDTVMTVWMPELAEGYKFSGWTVEGAEIVDGKFSMPDNAVFLRGTISKEQVKVDYKAQEGGLITDSNGLSDADLAEMVPYGENAKGATASAKMGYTFVEWQDANHKQVSTDPEFIPTNVTAPATYYAVFAKQKIKVEYTADVGGSIIGPSGATFSSVIEQVTYGEDADGATASAKPGYYFVRWVDAEGNEVGTELSFAPENVTKEAVYKAVFAKYYAVNYVPVGTPEGTDLPQPENPYRAGDEVVLMDAPKVDGYKFEGWYKDANCTEEAENFVMPAEDVTIYGKFTAATDTKYTVEHYFADVHGQYPDKPNHTETKTGTTLTDTKAGPILEEQRPGFVVAEGWENEKIQPDGNTVIRIYYEREVYNIIWQTSGEPAGQEQTFETRSFFYGADISEVKNPDVKQFDGYTWSDWEIQNPGMTDLPGTMPADEIAITGSYTAIDYKVTYDLAKDSKTPENYTVPVDDKVYHVDGNVIVKDDPSIPGYGFEGWYTEDGAKVTVGKNDPSFSMPAGDVTLYGKFTFATDTKYTVEHYFENLGGGYPAEPNHTESKAGTTSQRTEAMPIPAGSITGFTVDGSWKQQTIKPDGSTVVKIYYTRNSYNLTVHYRNVGGAAVADSHHGTYKFGETWKVVSPIVAGYYDPQIRSISSGANGMPAQDLEYVVIYTAIPVPAPDPGPGPAPNPGPDDGDDDDDTPPVPDPEQEQPPQPQDFEIDPDDYTLTEVEDNETPLANLNLEGHTCCILHLLLMLAAMVVLGFDTKSRKKHQARIFELKKMLAMEEDHSDDPEQP